MEPHTLAVLHCEITIKCQRKPSSNLTQQDWKQDVPPLCILLDFNFVKLSSRLLIMSLWQLRVWEGPRSGFIGAPVIPGYGRDQPRSHVYSCWLCLGDVPHSSPGSLLWGHQRPFFYVLISPVIPPYSSLKGKSHEVWVNTVANSTWLKTCLLWKGGVLIEQTKGCWWSDPLKKDKDYFFNISIYTHSNCFSWHCCNLNNILAFFSFCTR